jgi:hypothetical protein
MQASNSGQWWTVGSSGGPSGKAHKKQNENTKFTQARTHSHIHIFHQSRSLVRSLAHARALNVCVCVCVCVCGVWCICILYHTGTRATALSWWNHGNNTHDWQAQLDAASKVGVV